MNNQTTNTDKIKTDIPMGSLDEFDVDEFTFTPVTKGLGFHHSEKKGESFKKASQPISRVSTKSSVPKKSTPISLKSDHKFTDSMSSKGLGAFYNKEEKVQKIESPLEKKTAVEVKLIDASVTERFIAWVIDLSFVMLMVGVTIALISLTVGLDKSVLLNMAKNINVMSLVSIIFCLYYLAYFSILELVSTPGKNLLGINVITISKKQLTMKDTLGRALITLLSLIAMGLPSLIDFQSKLTDTRVVK